MTLKHIFPKTAFFNDFSRQGSKVRDLYNLFYILTILDKVVLQFFQAAKSTGICYIIFSYWVFYFEMLSKPKFTVDLVICLHFVNFLFVILGKVNVN